MMLLGSLKRGLDLIHQYNLCRCSIEIVSSVCGIRIISSFVLRDLLAYERKKLSESNSRVSSKNIIGKSRNKDRARKEMLKNIVEINSDEERIMHLAKSVKCKQSCYIARQDAADTLVKHLKKDLLEEDILVEAHLGTGILTKTIFEQTMHNIIGYEPNKEMEKYLLSEMWAYEARLELHCMDLLKVYWYYILNKREPENEYDRLAKVLEPISAKRQENSRVRIVSSLSGKSFLYDLTVTYTFQCGFFKDLFPIFYLYVPDDVYRQLQLWSTNRRINRWIVPFIYYFDVQHLDSAPYNNFYLSRLRRKNTPENLHLVKVTPKENIDEIVEKHELPTFHYFLTCLINARSRESLIFYLEKWIPGCGVDFIKNGFPMFVHPRELTEEELLAAYRLFISLPSYQDCVFHQFCKNWTIEVGLKDFDFSENIEVEGISDEDI